MVAVDQNQWPDGWPGRRPGHDNDREDEIRAAYGLTNFSAYWSVLPRMAGSKIVFV